MLTTGGGRIWQDETKDSTMWSEDRYNAFMARQAIDDEDLLRLESYTATIEPVDGSKREMLHQLAMTVFWPHRGRDIDLFLRLGQGYVACDEIGRPLGSAMYFPMGTQYQTFSCSNTILEVSNVESTSSLLRYPATLCNAYP